MMGDPERLLPKEEVTRRATFLELFFDVVFIFALTRVSDGIARNLAHGAAYDAEHRLVLDIKAGEIVSGVGKSFFVLLALWTVWHSTTWVTSRYDPRRAAPQLVVIIALAASVVMGVAIPEEFGDRGLTFAVAFVTVGVSRPLVMLVAVQDREHRLVPLRVLITNSGIGILWIAGAVLIPGGWIRGALWALALGAEWVSTRVGWPVPGLGRHAVAKMGISGEHLGERYQQFFFIALGETVLVTGRVYSAGSFGAGQTTAFVLALGISVLFWWIYFHRAGHILPEAIRKSPEPARIAQSTADSHLIMLAGIVYTAAGFHAVISHPYGPESLLWITVILGPALFMVGRARLEYEVFARLSLSRVVVLVVLVALVPVTIHLPPLAALIAAAVVLAATAVADARRAWGRQPEPPSPPP